ncbi:MAG TPA: M1 family aminopeptidase [Terriglobales bacterium]|nr:M1 family aminopeptidase [Terriglobales bacterium]
MRHRLLSLILSLVIFTGVLQSQTPAPNSDPVYQQLRNIALSSESVTVSNLDLKRDAATFHLRTGMVCFVAPVQGKVTGAVFVGDGNMVLDPPSLDEAKSLKLLTKENEFSENFEHLVLRFTDSTYEEIRKAGKPATGTCDNGLLQESQHTTRKKLHTNISARILQDLLSEKRGGLFVAFVHGKRYDSKLLFMTDPNGAWHAAPDEVELTTYGENKSGVWAAFHSDSTELDVQRHNRIHIEHQQLDTTIEKSGHMQGKAVTSFVALNDGIRAVAFDLFGTLRVQNVTGENGQPLSFIQEDKDDDPDFYVLLPKPLARGEKYTVTTVYGGKDAISNEGNGNYYPIARENWYPSNASAGLSDYSSFDMTFHIPKGMKMAASGTLVNESTESGSSTSIWKSDVPEPVAGFEFGRMREEDAKLTNFLIATYANEQPPDWAASLANTGTMGNLSTIAMMKQPLSEAEFAIPLYTKYFGQLPFKRLNVAQQTACNYGQSWPGLVWLPICAFYDATVRHNLGLDWSDNIYWDVVTPHEVAHQWWGQMVGFNSYRDQWMSEGFADFSASLFLQSAYGQNGKKKFMEFWQHERKTITERNQFGYRPIDVGPVTMGYRLDNSKVGGNVGVDLIYPKGAFILHMLRMMMWSNQTGDQNFREAMHDFTSTYSGRAASTEDFKAIVEKHMTNDMQIIGNGKMDWFFNEYVYGTSLPSYKLDSSFDKDPSGTVVLNLKITQSDVNNEFRMIVPVYLELSDGGIAFLGRMRLVGNTSSEAKVPLNGIKDLPKRAMLNYYDDVLSSAN